MYTTKDTTKKIFFMAVATVQFIIGINASFAVAADDKHEAGKCSKEDAKAAVLKMCDIIEKKGDESLKDIQSFRFCGDNYVWVQDSDLMMVIHPIKPKLNKTSLKENKDENGKFLFVEFDKAAKSQANGGWVEYVWPKPKAENSKNQSKLCHARRSRI